MNNPIAFYLNRRGIFFITSTGRPDALNKLFIGAGDRVQLHLDRDVLHVTEVEMLGPGRYRGRAEFFERFPEESLDGIRLGDCVEFEAGHVFGCVAS